MKRAVAGSPESGVKSSLPPRFHRFTQSLRYWVWLVPAFMALCLAFSCAVDVPYIDQWDADLPFLQKVAAGNASISDLVALHLEHRIAFARLAGLVAAYVAAWRTKACLLLTWLVMCGVAFNLLYLQRRTGSAGGLSLSLIAFLVGAVLFGVQSYDAWFNPMIITWAGGQLFLTGGLVLAVGASTFPTRFFGCMLLAWLATFSSSVGMLLWPFLIPSLVANDSRNQPKAMLPWLTGWVAVAALAISFYFWGFQRPPESPSFMAGPSFLNAIAAFFVAAVGAPLAFGTPLPSTLQAKLVGAAVIALVMICGVTTLACRRDKRFIQAVLPWFSIIAYAMTAQLAMAVGRAGSGPNVALASRYMPTANLTICALICLVPIVLDESVRRGRAEASRFAWLTDRRAKVIKASLFAALLAAQVIGAIATLPTYANEHIRLSAAKAAVLFSRCFKDPELLSKVWSHKTRVDIDDKLDFMDSNGYLRPQTFKSCKIADLPKVGQGRSSGTSFRGAIEQAGRVNEQAVGFTGWAIDSARGRPADAVLLSWEDDAFDATVFAIVPVGVPRPDMTAKLSSNRFLRAGWGRLFPKDAMPKRPCRIRAWAFNTDDGTIAELAGVVEWRPES